MRRFSLAVLCACAACGEPVTVPKDAGALQRDAGSPGTLTDGGTETSPDAGAFDAGRSFDAGTFSDAGLSRDAGTPDAGQVTITDAGSRVSYSLNFATAAIENPLSAGGVWTNNSQGTGGNVAPGNLTSMRVDLASDGVTRIAFDTHGGIEYDDSFAFVPGFSGDQWVEAVIYKEPGYNPNASGSNHELELILGCSSVAGGRTWNEFLMNAGGGVDIVYLSGGPSDFQSIGNVSGISAIPVDGDVVRATRVGNVLSLYLNGALWLRYDGSNPAVVAKGSGIGIAAFIRPGATHNKYGFKQVTMGSL